MREEVISWSEKVRLVTNLVVDSVRIGVASSDFPVQSWVDGVFEDALIFFKENWSYFEGNANLL